MQAVAAILLFWLIWKAYKAIRAHYMAKTMSAEQYEELKSRFDAGKVAERDPGPGRD